MKAQTMTAERTPHQRLMEDALCAEIGGDLWFPPKGGSNLDALRACAMCPVQQECLDFALEFEATQPTRHGVWAGTSPNQRERIAKERGILPPPRIELVDGACSNGHDLSVEGIYLNNDRCVACARTYSARSKSGAAA